MKGLFSRKPKKADQLKMSVSKASTQLSGPEISSALQTLLQGRHYLCSVIAIMLNGDDSLSEGDRFLRVRGLLNLIRGNDADIIGLYRLLIDADYGKTKDVFVWRERTPFVLLWAAAATQKVATKFLDTYVGSVITELLRFAGTPPDEAIAAAAKAILERMIQYANKLPLEMQYCLKEISLATQGSPLALGNFLYLRFVVPFLAHPAHTSNRDGLKLLSKVIISVASLQPFTEERPDPQASLRNMVAEMLGNAETMYRALDNVKPSKIVDTERGMAELGDYIVAQKGKLRAQVLSEDVKRLDSFVSGWGETKFEAAMGNF